MTIQSKESIPESLLYREIEVTAWIEWSRRTAAMCPLPELLHLSRLLDNCIHPFHDLTADSITKETEKHLLVALSQVLRQVKQWTHELGSTKLVPLEEIDGHSNHLIAAAPYLDNRQYFSKIISDLILLLAINNRYAQNLVGNILVVIFEFVITLDSGWDDFVHLMCDYMKLTVGSILTGHSEHDSLETRGPDNDPSMAMFLLKLKSKSASWSVVAAIFRVLHNIQKYLKKDFNCETMKPYINRVGITILNLSAGVLRQMEDALSTEASKDSVCDALKRTDAVKTREVAEFFGNFIQFLCSLVTLSSSVEEGAGFLPVFCKITDLVPRLASWCHVDHQSLHQIRAFHYMWHKVLLLMVKLSYNNLLEQTTVITWMHLIYKNFGDLLLRPIYGSKFDADGFLEGSPFCKSVFSSREQNISSPHLQRLTVFLFLKFSLNLVSIEGKSDESAETCYTNLDAEYQNTGVVSMKLHKWLLAHVPADTFVDGKLNIQRCLQFTQSFLRLYMHEDDILFEVLLVLLNIPSLLNHQTMKGKSHHEVKDQTLFLSYNLFNPIHLFHLFLGEIFYDHQVILDYLISKDTGSICVEYFLRSLRIVCSSWTSFTEFPRVYENQSPPCSKRQKISADVKDSSDASYPENSKHDTTSSVQWKHRKVDANANSQSNRNQNPPFLAARDCLVSLRTSIVNLNRKKLFPYNPKALVGRLTRFEELAQ